MINRVGKIFTLQGALLLLIINLGFLVWYIFIGYQADFHSDSAVKVLLAREIVATDDYFPNDWNYINNDLLVLFGHTFILPLLAVIPAGFVAHAVSGLVASLLILLSVWLVTGLSKIGIVHRLLIVALMAAGISGFTAENLFGQVSYGTVLYFSCFILFFAWEYLNTSGRKKLVWGLLLLALVILVFWSNPQRALIAYVLPLIVAVAFMFINLQASNQIIYRKAMLTLLLFVGVGIICGIVLHVQTISGVNNIMGAGHARWLSYELMLRNASFLLKGYLAIFGALPEVDGIVVSKSGVYQVARLFIALSLLVLAPIVILRIIQRQEPVMVFLAGFIVTAFALVILIQLATTVPDMTDPVQSSRYLVVSLVLFLLIVLMQPLDFKNYPLCSGISVLLFVVLLTSAYPTFIRSDGSSNMHWGMLGQRSNVHQGIADYLLKNELKYGYATYWHAGVTSVLSGEYTLVRQIIINNGIPMPMRHLSSNRWYRPNAWQGETFLLLTNEEAQLLDLKKMAILGVVPSQIKEFSGFKIYVFSENIAGKIPGWDTRYETPMKLMVNKFSLSQIGKLYASYDSSETALVAERGESGALHFGPYINVDPGRYRVTFDIVADHNSAGVVKLDVAAAPDQKVYGEKFLTESREPQTIEFSLDTPRSLEFRVWVLGNARVVFRGESIQRLPDNASN